VFTPPSSHGGGGPFTKVRQSRPPRIDSPCTRRDSSKADRRLKNALILIVALVASALTAVLGSYSNELPTSSGERKSVASTASSPRVEESYVEQTIIGREHFVGSAACVSCHRAESEAYLGSHHAKALVETNIDAKKAHFDGTNFMSKKGGVTTFTVRNGAAVVNTPITQGKSAILPVPYVSGVWPLQQYVVESERGKLQSLGVVRDTREPASSSWFHVYGAEGIAPRDPLFFTSAAQNWNHMCADCHSTWVERRYDAASDSFDTQWAELSVGCEACHGPGAEHVRSAQQDPRKVSRFAAPLRHAEPWVPSATGSPTPRSQDGVQVEVCAPCHSRRAPLAEGFVASDQLLDHFQPELLWPGRYHSDGQVEGEVYEWGSFTQSRMYQAGVTCSDCHNPHSGKPYASGDTLCGRCHEADRFQAPAHSHHVGANAPRCIDCHMPPTTFMQIDERRDHSIRIPRPDHSVTFGTPNACNTCHDKQTATWARDWTRQWYPTLEGREHFVAALGKERQGAPDARLALRKLALDAAQPAIARATALERLGSYPSPDSRATLRTALGVDEGLVVYGAVLGATALPLAERLPLLLPLLQHKMRAVRIAVGKALAGVTNEQVPVAAQAALERAFTEVRRSFDVSASRAETHVERSAFEITRGNIVQAEASLQTALRLSPCLTEAHLNRAERFRQQRDERSAEREIRAALRCSPDSAGAHHALGLWQVRAKQKAAALDSLSRASELAPTDARFSYVLAVALGGEGKLHDAIRILDANLGLHPNDVPSLRALSRYLADVGDQERATKTRRRLETLLQP
jgi:Tfp pilus assembly protein PilF